MSRSAPPGVRPADLLPELHRRLLEATNGIRSVLLRQSSKGDYKALSGRGFAELGDVWLTGDEAADLDSLTVGGAPRTTAREALPSLVDRLGAPYALLMPVRPARIRTVLAVGIEENTHSLADRAATVATGFAAALEMAALEREIRLHRRLRELLLLFSRGISSTAEPRHRARDRRDRDHADGGRVRRGRLAARSSRARARADRLVGTLRDRAASGFRQTTRHIRRRGASGSIARRLSTASSSLRCGPGDVRSAHWSYRRGLQ